MNNIIDAIRNRNIILFAGGGTSASIGLPTYRSLIEHLALELGYDPAEFMDMGNYLELAEFYKLQRGSLAELRRWMDVHWHGSNIDISKSHIHKHIIDLNFPIIYTTNYDRWLELAFESHGAPYTQITNVQDILKIHENSTQIVKFHGDFAEDESILLTESNYFDRLEFESPLDIKLRADILAKSILFIGYSLSDINVRLLLYKLHKLWSASNFANTRPVSYFFMTKPNKIQETILESRGIVTIPSQKADPTAGLEDFLGLLVAGLNQ